MTTTVFLPASAFTSVGASGSLSGVPSTPFDSFDQPTSFLACTLNEYVLPFFKPVIWQEVTEPHDFSPEPSPLHVTLYSLIGLPFEDPAVQLRFTAPSCGSPAMGESRGASGLSITETLMVPVTSRSFALVASRTLTITLLVLAPMLEAALIDTTPLGGQSTVSFDAPSDVHPVTVNVESGNGLYASASRFTSSLLPALTFTVFALMRAKGLLEAVTRTVTPALTVPFEYWIEMSTITVVPGDVVLSADTVSSPFELTLALTWSESAPPEYVYCFSSSYRSDAEWVNAVRSMVVALSPATTSIVGEENVGAGMSRPITVIGNVNTAELMIFTLSFLSRLPSTAVKVMDAGPE